MSFYDVYICLIQIKNIFVVLCTPHVGENGGRMGGGQGVRALMDYLLLPTRMHGRLLDINVLEKKVEDV